MQIDIKTVVTLLATVAAIVASYYDALRRIDKKVDKEELQKTINGIRGTIQDGMKDMTESYHEVDLKQAELDIRLKLLEQNGHSSR